MLSQYTLVGICLGGHSVSFNHSGTFYVFPGPSHDYVHLQSSVRQTHATYVPYTSPVASAYNWLRVEALCCCITPAPVPTAILSPSTTALIGDTVPLAVTFSNTGDAPGYGPFVDVELPTAGNVPTSSNGLDYVSGSATYLGLSVQTQVLTFDASGHVVHPFLLTSSGQPAVITGTPGDELVVFTLPLGSFEPSQPSATIDFSAQLSTLATLSVPLPIAATGGFQFGADPVNDPTGDPSIVGSPNTSTVTPTLFQIQKT